MGILWAVAAAATADEAGLGRGHLRHRRLLLEARGLRVWYGNAMLNGSTPAMEEAVRHSAAFVLFLSEDPDLALVLQPACQNRSKAPKSSCDQPWRLIHRWNRHGELSRVGQ